MPDNSTTKKIITKAHYELHDRILSELEVLKSNIHIECLAEKIHTDVVTNFANNLTYQGMTGNRVYMGHKDNEDDDSLVMFNITSSIQYEIDDIKSRGKPEYPEMYVRDIDETISMLNKLKDLVKS